MKNIKVLFLLNLYFISLSPMQKDSKVSNATPSETIAIEDSKKEPSTMTEVKNWVKKHPFKTFAIVFITAILVGRISNSTWPPNKPVDPNK